MLVADDNELNRQVISELLRKLGITPTLAHHGRECVEQLQHAPGDFDLVLMDMQMPEMDGLEATALIRDQLQLSRLPIIALTANAMAADRQRCLDIGMNDFLSKPINVKELSSKLEQWLSAHHTAG